MCLQLSPIRSTNKIVGLLLSGTWHWPIRGSQLTQKQSTTKSKARIRWSIVGEIVGLNMLHINSMSHPNVGPLTLRSKTWAGFRSCLNLLMKRTPWLSPLFELTNTSSGLLCPFVVASDTLRAEVSRRRMAVGATTDMQFKPSEHLVWKCCLQPLWT